jgi:hypothetical protein
MSKINVTIAANARPAAQPIGRTGLLFFSISRVELWSHR